MADHQSFSLALYCVLAQSGFNVMKQQRPTTTTTNNDLERINKQLIEKNKTQRAMKKFVYFHTIQHKKEYDQIR